MSFSVKNLAFLALATGLASVSTAQSTSGTGKTTRYWYVAGIGKSAVRLMLTMSQGLLQGLLLVARQGRRLEPRCHLRCKGLAPERLQHRLRLRQR